MGVWTARLREARVPGSSIPTPTSLTAGGRRRSPAGEAGCAGRRGTCAGPWPLRHSSGCTVCQSLTLGLGVERYLAPCALSAPGKVWFKAKTPELIYLNSLTVFGARKSWDWAARSARGPLCAEWVESIELPLKTELKETHIKTGSNSVVWHRCSLARSLPWFLLSSRITSNLPSPTSTPCTFTHTFHIRGTDFTHLLCP